MINFGDAITKISSKDIILGKPGKEIATNFLKQHISQYSANVGDSFTKNFSKPFYAEDFHGKLSSNIGADRENEILNSFTRFITNNPFYKK